MAELGNWNVSAGSNTSAPPDGWPEGMAPSAVNNTAREMMAVLARAYGDVNGSLSSGGSANAYTLTPNRTISNYAAGLTFVFLASFTNTGAATLNVSSLGAKNILKLGATALSSGDITSGQLCFVTYDGTQFQLLSSAPPAGISTPISVANGGTNATTTAAARSNLGLSTDAIQTVIGDGQSQIPDASGNLWCPDVIVPFDCTITSCTLLANQSGSISIQIWKDSYANFPPTVADLITASATPTISSSTKSQDTTLTGWTKSLSAGDVLRFSVTSNVNIRRVTLVLGVTR